MHFGRTSIKNLNFCHSRETIDKHTNTNTKNISFFYLSTLPSRVTRLGEFSPIKRLLTLGIFLRSSPEFGATFIHGKNSALILTIMGWATFWAIFS
jgi:hypothetical protein